MDSDLDSTFAALADPTRRAILARLAGGSATVSELVEPFALSQPAISKHLRVLEDAGLVETSTEGRARPRRLRPGGLGEARAYVENIASFWPDRFDRLEQFLADSKESEE